jgi:hypothetical protein
MVDFNNLALQYDRKVELYYRNKKIEEKEETLKVIPSYVPDNEDYDVLFIIDHEHRISKKEFSLYMHIFEGLGLKCNFWNSWRYSGVSIDSKTKKRHPVSWVGKYHGKLIVIPLAQPQDFDSIAPEDIIDHFVSKDGKSYDSGLILIGGPSPKEVRKKLYYGVPAIPFSEDVVSDLFVIGSPVQHLFDNKLKGKHHEKI